MVKLKTQETGVYESGRKTKVFFPVNLRLFLERILRIVVFIGLVFSLLLMNIRLPDIAGGWRLYWVMLFTLLAISVGLILLWIKQGYLKLYWGRFAGILLGLFSLLGIKYWLDRIMLPANIFDRLSLTPLPLFTILWAGLLSVAILVTFLNYFKGDFEKLVQYFQTLVIAVLTVSAILVAYVVRYGNIIVQNGGIFNYFMKGVFLSINPNRVLQSILTLGFGGAAISSVIYLIFSNYWLIKSISASSKNLRVASLFMFVFWGILSLITAITSLDLLVMWLIIILILSLVYVSKLTGFRSLNKATKFLLVVLIFVVVLLVGVLILKSLHIKALKFLGQYVIAQKASILSVFKWVTLFKSFNTVATGLNFYNNVLKLVVFGFPLSTGLQVAQSLQLIGISIKTMPTLLYLLEFGLLAILGFVSYVYVIFKFIKLIDADTLILAIFIPIVLYPLFVMPNLLGWLLFSIATGFVLAVVFRAEIITLGIYKLGSGNRKATSVLWLTLGIVAVLGIFKLINLYKVFQNYHLVVQKQARVINELNVVTGKYAKSLSKYKKDSTINDKQIKIKALQQLDVNKINVLRNDIREFSGLSFWLGRKSLNSQMAEITRYNLYKQLEFIGINFPDLYSYLLGAPNTDALNNYVTELYILQRDTSLPVVYKLLGNSWEELAKLQRSPVYTTRAMNNYDRYLWFKPLDYGVLNRYIVLLLQQYKALSADTSVNNASNLKLTKQALEGVKVKLQVLLQLFSRSATNVYIRTGSLEPILTATTYTAQFYKLTGDVDKAKKAFEPLIKFVEQAKLNNKQKQEILDIINKVRDSVISNPQEEQSVNKRSSVSEKIGDKITSNIGLSNSATNK